VSFVSLLAAKSPDPTKKYFDGEIANWIWILLGVIIVAMLAIDLIRHDDEHEPTAKEALKESLVWVGVSLAFGAFVLWQLGGLAFGEYMSGYVLEKSLSVDNVFVWALIFGSFKIPLRYQHRVLFWGIFGALAFRAIFIVLGKTLIDRFSWTLVLFGLFLAYTGLKILRHKEDEEEEEAKQSGLGLLRKIMPVTDRYDGKKFFTLENGKRAATPLFACLVVVEFTDIVFAVDSVPAILAVAPKSSFIVFASNAFAILGLRAMYFLLADAKERFHYLSTALGVILIFVGAKMVATFWDKHLPDIDVGGTLIRGSYISLLIILTILGIGIFASLKMPPQPKGSLKGQS
jgi:tellurite resistance protein TerC